MSTNQADINAKVNLIKDIANKLRGPYSSEKFGNVIIPMAILRRFDCMLESKNSKIKEILARFEKIKSDEKIIEQVVLKECGVPFYNKKCVSFTDLIGDSDNIGKNFIEFISAYSPSIANIITGLKFKDEVTFMNKKGNLFNVVKSFSEVDFHPETTNELTMGYIFEEIIRTYRANAEAGDHYTPREVVELCVDLICSENIDSFKKDGKIVEAYDGCCGTGGMLTITKRKLNELIGKPLDKIKLYGQEINPESCAVCRAEMLILGNDPKNIYENNTLTEDKFGKKKFDILITNPPFGFEWKNEKIIVDKEAAEAEGRFFGGTPRVNDGQLLFLQNLISKAEEDARIAIIHNGSPLFSGDAAGGESNIRRYIIANDYLEAIVALPNQMFYNTDIYSYIWILSKNKLPNRRKKIQLINAVDFYEPMRPKSLGKKRKFVSDQNKIDIVKLYNDFSENKYSKIFDGEDFGYTKVTIERPLRDENGNIVLKKGKKQSDGSLRDTENIPIKKDIDKYMQEEVTPFVPDAWADRSKDKEGYEIPFTRYFHQYSPPKNSNDILIKVVELENGIKDTIEKLLRGVKNE